MNKVVGFLAGALSGAVVGAAASFLFTPSSGRDLRTEARMRWQNAVAEARNEMQRTEQELQTQFEHMRSR